MKMKLCITFNPIALRMAKIVCYYGLSECNRDKINAMHTLTIIIVHKKLYLIRDLQLKNFEERASFFLDLPQNHPCFCLAYLPKPILHRSS